MAQENLMCSSRPTDVKEKWEARGAVLWFGGEGAMVVSECNTALQRMMERMENKSSAYEDGTQARIPVVDEHVCQRNGRTDGHLKWSAIMGYSFREEV